MLDLVFGFLATAHAVVLAILQLSLAISGMLCIWGAQNCWNAEGWDWCVVLAYHNKGEFDAAHAKAQQATGAFHLGWVLAGLGMIMLFLAGVIR